MESNNQSIEHASVPGQPEAVRYEPRQLEYGQRSVEQNERLGGLVANAERYPAAPERQSQPPVVPLASDDASLPPPQSVSGATTANGTASSDTPLVAADEDVIEKEWVDKVKRVLADTKDDPYKREQQVKQLQIEYVRKRYGREIGSAGD